MQAKLWTLNGLAVELGRDRRALARDLEGLEPDTTRQTGSRTERRWRLRHVIEHLMRPTGESTEGLDAEQERARRDKEAADKLALENAETRGDIARVSVMVREVGSMLADHRQRALGIPSKLAPMLVGLTAPGIQIKLEDAIYELLGDLADYRPGGRAGADSKPDPNARSG